MSSKLVSKTLLKKLPEELEKKQLALLERETKLSAIESELKMMTEEIEVKKNYLEKKEEKIDKKIQQILKERIEDIEKKEKLIEKKEQELNKTLKIVKSADKFGDFYTHLDQMYNLYVAAKGNDSNILETIKMIIDARSNFVSNSIKK